MITEVARVDSLVEVDRYVNGCHVNPVPYGCLDCPLATCIYDDSNALVKAERDRRREKVAELVAGGMRWPSQIARALNVSRRTAHRDLRALGVRTVAPVARTSSSSPMAAGGISHA